MSSAVIILRLRKEPELLFPTKHNLNRPHLKLLSSKRSLDCIDCGAWIHHNYGHRASKATHSELFAKYVIASWLMTGLNPFLALGLSQKWQNKRVWKILRCFNAIRQWDDIAQSWTWLTYIFAHFNSIEEGNENLLGLLHDSRIWTHFQFCSLNNIFYVVLPGVPTSFG